MNWLEILPGLAPVVAAITASLTVVLDDRRWMLAMLGGEYVCLAWLVSLELPLGLAAAKLIVGLCVCAALAITVIPRGRSAHLEPRWVVPSGRLFRLIAVLLVSISAWGLTRNGWAFVPSLSRAAATGSMILIGMGLLHLGISEEPFRVGIALLTTLAGFEVAYSAIEPSLAVMSLLAAVHLGLAVVLSYLIMNLPGAEEPGLGGP